MPCSRSRSRRSAGRTASPCRTRSRTPTTPRGDPDVRVAVAAPAGQRRGAHHAVGRAVPGCRCPADVRDLPVDRATPAHQRCDGGQMTHVLVVDNYDSFVYNLVQYLGQLGVDVTVRRNDAVTPDEL